MPTPKPTLAELTKQRIAADQRVDALAREQKLDERRLHRACLKLREKFERDGCLVINGDGLLHLTHIHALAHRILARSRELLDATADSHRLTELELDAVFS